MSIVGGLGGLGWEPNYCTAEELKSVLRIEDTADDGEGLIPTWITTASRTVDMHCHRQFGMVTEIEERRYRGTWDRRLSSYVYEIDDLQDLTDFVIVDGDGGPVDDQELEPFNALQKGKPYERLISASGPIVAITAWWGWAAVPAAVKNATLLQASRLSVRRDSPYGIAGSPTEGGEQRLLATVDPDVKVSLSKYRREVWAA